jgi:hypothetical protein
MAVKPFPQFFRPGTLTTIEYIEYIEKEIAKICCPVLPMWSVSTLLDKTG